MGLTGGTRFGPYEILGPLGAGGAPAAAATLRQAQGRPGAEDGRGRRWQISNEGGSRARWSTDGHQLFFLSLDDASILSAAIRAHGDAIENDPPRVYADIQLMLETRSPVRSGAGRQERARARANDQSRDAAADGHELAPGTRAVESLVQRLSASTVRLAAGHSRANDGSRRRDVRSSAVQRASARSSRARQSNP